MNFGAVQFILIKSAVDNFAIPSENRPERNMHRVAVFQPTDVPSHLEDHLEVLPLGRADHVDVEGCANVVHAITEGRKVSCCVAKPTIALAKDQRQGVARPSSETIGKDAQRAVANDGVTARLQLRAEALKKVVVLTLHSNVRKWIARPVPEHQQLRPASTSPLDWPVGSPECSRNSVWPSLRFRTSGDREDFASYDPEHLTPDGFQEQG